MLKKFSKISSIIKIKKGRMFILVDDKNRKTKVIWLYLDQNVTQKY